MFLTADQLAELTDAQKPSVQIRWLKERGWPFEVSAKDRVARAARRATGLRPPATTRSSPPAARCRGRRPRLGRQ